MKKQISFRVNEEKVTVVVKPHWTLLRVIRDELGLTGTKEGCGEGECGSCTVLLDSVPINSCLVLAMDAEDKSITTIEGLAKGEKLHPLQTAFIEKGAIQCGYCTPGMILTAKWMLDQNTSLNEESIRMGLAGNLCRCTGYVKIIEAVQEAGAEMANKEKNEQSKIV
jgi:carbon-monoxide dehydrogenase small subunit